MPRVAVAMSGGVDSAVAAALLVEQGHDVVGLTMNVWPAWLPVPDHAGGGCCGVGAIEDARSVARYLGIRHYVLNVREVFERSVIDHFCDQYANGHTPNPCIDCNRAVKFGALMDRAGAMGCDLLATGHHARIAWDPASGRFRLMRGRDPRKDQSYVLFSLTQAQMARLRFPVGDYTKAEVRAAARRLGLPVSGKPDSQEICFVPRGRYHALVAARRPGAALGGPILSLSGAVVGTHAGIGRYTVGQRRGLGLAASAPSYVVDIDPRRNAVIVGGCEDLLRDHLLVGSVDWIAPPPPGGRVTVRVRHGGADVPASVRHLPGGRVRVSFVEPQRAAAPGQAAVFYDGDFVLGGGIIEREDPQERR
jgi:tRNA-specific 2-thiouridylase